jgi:hypothetical protein
MGSILQGLVEDIRTVDEAMAKLVYGALRRPGRLLKWTAVVALVAGDE